jgi:hypothetical protein
MKAAFNMSFPWRQPNNRRVAMPPGVCGIAISWVFRCLIEAQEARFVRKHREASRRSGRITEIIVPKQRLS